MGTTKAEIAAWLDQGKRDGAKFMLVVVDTFSYDDYPVYVMANTSVTAEVSRYSKDMQKVMEVYSYAQDLETQLLEHRAWHVT